MNESGDSPCTWRPPPGLGRFRTTRLDNLNTVQAGAPLRTQPALRLSGHRRAGVEYQGAIQSTAGPNSAGSPSKHARRPPVPRGQIQCCRCWQSIARSRRMIGASTGPDYQDHNLIFCQPTGAQYSPDRVGARVKESMVAVGLEGVNLHSLRHTHASELLSKGVPIAVVSERLGHADQNITLSIYSHAMPADSRAAARIWDDALGDLIEESKKPRTDRTTAHYCTEGTQKEVFAERKRS